MRRVALLTVLMFSALALAAPKKKAKPAPKPPPPPPTSPMPKVEEHLSDKVLEVWAATTRVQAWRVMSTNGVRPDPAKAIGSEWTREAAGKELEAKDLATLRGLLYDEKSYRFEQDVSRCNFTPDVSFQALSGVDTVEGVVSFKCNQVVFMIGKPGGRWLPMGSFDVKPARGKLLELAKAMLDKDAPTQNLK
ncbi:MAG: hypothetical protein IAE78_24770 [Myxococcus sp.]|nr:hypothetical protein [Myxococcus sp.]